MGRLRRAMKVCFRMKDEKGGERMVELGERVREEGIEIWVSDERDEREVWDRLGR